MLKLNHNERGIAIAALKEAQINWDKLARQLQANGNGTDAAYTAANAARANDLRIRFEEEQA